MNRIFESAYIYALLIFLGFYNYYSYYIHFDIKIATFLTPGELLLSFLPLTLPIVVIVVILVVLHIKAIVEISSESKEKLKKNDREIIPDLFILGSVWRNLKESISAQNFKSFSGVFFIFLDVLGIIIGIGIILFFIGFIFYFLLSIEGKYVNPSIVDLIIYGFLWFIIFDELTELAYNNNMKAMNISRFFMLILFTVGLINISNANNAKEILNGKNKREILFEYNNVIIKTDSNLVYIGKTEKYFFLRNLNGKQNYLYPLDKIGLIQMKDLKQK